MQFSPIFESVMAKIKSYPESDYDKPAVKRLFRLATKYAPPELNDLFMQRAMDQGMFPKPTHCDDNGAPIYSLEEIAAFFGQTPEQAQQAFNDMIADDPSMMDGIHRGTVHRLQ